MCTTVPSKPASPITRFDPPPSTSSGSPSASAARTALTTSADRCAVMNLVAGPPSRRVVYPARSTPARTSAPVWELVTVVNGSLRPMARRIDHRSRYRWDAKTVYSTLVDPAYLTERLAALGGNGANLAYHSVGADGGVSYRLRHGVAGSDLPGPVRTLLGGDLMLDRDETWRPDPSGGYRGTVKVTLP